MKQLINNTYVDPKTKEEQCSQYEAPTIIYEGVINTRAGSPFGRTDGNDGIDPADLFGE